jgi:hypothetical protein
VARSRPKYWASRLSATKATTSTLEPATTSRTASVSPVRTTPRIITMIPSDWKVATNSSGIRETLARESWAR